MSGTSSSNGASLILTGMKIIFHLNRWGALIYHRAHLLHHSSRELYVSYRCFYHCGVSRGWKPNRDHILHFPAILPTHPRRRKEQSARLRPPEPIWWYSRSQSAVRNVSCLLQLTRSETTISEKSDSIKNKEHDWSDVTGATVFIFGCVETTFFFFILNVLASTS